MSSRALPRPSGLAPLWLTAALALPACGPPVRGVLKLHGTPRDALVTVDDRYVGKLAAVEHFGIELPAGEHTVTVEKPGYFPSDVLIRVPPDGVANATLELTAIPD